MFREKMADGTVRLTSLIPPVDLTDVKNDLEDVKNGVNDANDTINGQNIALLKYIDQSVDDVMNLLQDLTGTVQNITDSANGRNTNYYQPDEPQGIFVSGDQWFDSDDSYKLRVWDGTAWVDPIDAMLVPLRGEIDAHDSELATLNSNLDAANAELDAIFPITEVKIDDDAITAPKIRSEAVLTRHITVNTLDGDRIRFNSMHGDKAIINSIAVSRLAVTDLRDYMADPNFDRVAQWTFSGGGSVFQTLTSPPTTTTNNVSLAMTANGVYGAHYVTDGAIPLVPGEEFVLTSLHKVSATAPNGSYAIAMYYFDWAGNYVSSAALGLNLGVGGTWTETTFEVTVPEGVASGQLRVVRQATSNNGGVLYMDQLHCRKKNSGQLIVDGTLFSKHVATEGLDAGLIKFGEMEGARIKVDSLDGKVVKAGTLAATAVVISDLTNLIPDVIDWGQFNVGTVISNKDTSSNYCVITGNGSGNTHISMGPGSDIPVIPGDELRFRWTVYANYTGFSGNIIAYGQWLRADKTLLSGWAGPNTPQGTNSYLEKTADLVVPTSAAYFRFIPYATASAKGAIRGAWLRRKNGGDLIVDGAIDGKVITGATVQTGANGSRLVFNAVGLKAYNASNAQTLDISGTTGDILVGPTTGTFPAQVRIGTFTNLSTGTGQGAIRLISGGTGWGSSDLQAYIEPNSGNGSMSTMWNSPYPNAVNGYTALQKSSRITLTCDFQGFSSAFVFSNSNTTISSNSSFVEVKPTTIFAYATVKTSVQGDSELYLNTNSSGTGVTYLTAGNAWLLYKNLGSYPFLTRNGANAGLQFMADRLRAVNAGASGFVNIEANAFVVSSDVRLKRSIERSPKGALDRLSALSSYDYKIRNGNGRKQRGFMAHEVEKVLPHAVSTDENGQKGVSLYDLFPEVVAAIQELRAEVQELKSNQKDNT